MPRDSRDFWLNMQTMWDKMNKHLSGNELKYEEGGLLHLEFFIQFLILCFPQTYFVSQTNIYSQLNLIYHAQIISKETYQDLKKSLYVFS